jgi:hypothetical protein
MTDTSGSPEPSISPGRRRKRLGCGIALAVIGLIIAGIAFTPPYTFHPLCTYDLIHRVDATIEVDGQRYSAQAVRQNSFSRRWFAEMNSAGCVPTKGLALSFRLADNRVLLVGTEPCQKARQELADVAFTENNHVNLLELCPVPLGHIGLEQWRPHGFLIDNADHPTRWSYFWFGEKLKNSESVPRVISAVATATRARPFDTIDAVIPRVLDSKVEYKEWGLSPYILIPYQRWNINGNSPRLVQD